MSATAFQRMRRIEEEKRLRHEAEAGQPASLNEPVAPVQPQPESTPQRQGDPGKRLYQLQQMNKGALMDYAYRELDLELSEDMPKAQMLECIQRREEEIFS